jgi:hypothetical protein
LLRSSTDALVLTPLPPLPEPPVAEAPPVLEPPVAETPPEPEPPVAELPPVPRPPEPLPPVWAPPVADAPPVPFPDVELRVGDAQASDSRQQQTRHRATGRSDRIDERNNSTLLT